MRRIYLIPLTIISIVFLFNQCSLSGKKGLLNTDSLSTQQFRIDISKDTNIRTLNGAIIYVPAGAFKSSNGFVSLEIKEAYAVEDMLKAGLTTRSNGNILSSGGMFYINTKENAELIKPISIALPGSPLVKEMKLYKGDQKGDSINWVNPTALPENPQLKAINTGHEIFINKCAACHSDTLSKDATGPALAHVTKRLTKEWLYAFTRSNSSMRANYQYSEEVMDYPSDSTKRFYHKHDRYAECIFQKWNGIVMPNFTDMSDDELGDLYSYIENKSNLEVLPVPPVRYLNLAMDSCDKYQRALDSLSSKREQLIEENEMQTSEVTGRIFGENDLCDNCPPKVTPNEYRSMYYQFSITATGWYNIDVLLNELPGVQASKLIVQVDKPVTATFILYLIIPSHKVIADGGLLEGSTTEYCFHAQNGECPLPQNVPAWIVLAGEDGEGNIIFSRKDFTTSTSQLISLQPKVINKEQFENEIDSLKLKEVNFKQTDSKNADEIRKTDKELKKSESLIPPGVDCSCGIRNAK